MKLSILIPVYNEVTTITTLLDRVRQAPLSGILKEIIVVDDHSCDGTRKLLEEYVRTHSDTYLLTHERNLGKGSAIRSALTVAKGDLILIQDADLEYDPNDYSALLKPILEGKAKVVYGSRFLGTSRLAFLLSWSRNRKAGKNHYYLSHFIGLQILNFLSNLLYRANITDEATCYKMFTREAILSLSLTCRRFEFCPEVTAKVRKKGLTIIEVPIHYAPRTTREGKKLSWKDGFTAIWTLIKLRF